MSNVIIKNLDGDVVFDGEVRELHGQLDGQLAFNSGGNDISMADLRGVNLRGVNLSSLVLTDTNLSGADLHCANLSYTNFKDADLSGADLSFANMLGADLEGANLNGVDLNCCVGNSSEIKSLFIFDYYDIIYTAKYIQINDIRCYLDKWFDAHSEDIVELEIFRREEDGGFDFWFKNKALLELILKSNPATKTGKE